MSLLMDVLKKAEAARHRAGDEPTGAAEPRLLLEPIDPEPTLQAEAGPTPAAEGMPTPPHATAYSASSASRAAAPALEPAMPRDSAVTRPTHVPPGAAEKTRPGGEAPTPHERDAVRSTFAAKDASPRQRWFWYAAGAGVLACIGIGAYVWWQLNGLATAGGLGLSASPPTVSAANLTVTTLQIPESAQTTPAPTAALPTVNNNDGQPLQPGVAADSALSPPSAALPAAVTAASPQERRVVARASEHPDTPSARTAPAIHRPRTGATGEASHTANALPGAPYLTRSMPRTSALLERGFTDLKTGHDAEAQHAYEQVLQSDAHNVDALLGLATLTARQGQSERAQSLYQRALEADPSDPTARAAVLGWRAQSDPESAESRLKTALSNQPESAALHFALGNLYAGQQRWSEAQQAYFQAYAGEPDDPNILFNLAVSLDNLRQSKLATQYYGMAQQAAGTRSASFDPEQVRRRLLELQH